MCGIAGVYSLNSSFFPSEAGVKRMIDVVSHRGPDGEGVWVNEDNKLILGHRRLSIIDLSAEASQPMHSVDGRFTIVFNGEIYNYRELRSSLVESGWGFKSHSDTEVLLGLYAQFGKECLSMLDGMFSFAIWDKHEKSLFCARDRFGEKPFYYSFGHGEYFAFSSEIKSIRAYFGNIQLDKGILQDYLSGSFHFDDIKTAFQGVQALPPSHCLFIRNGEIKIERYWEIDLSRKLKLENDKAYYRKFHELFMESVNYRLRSDVPVGSSLSGGLDSSTVVGALAGLEKKEMHTFSARFRSDKDEGKWIAEVVENTHMLNHEVWPDEDGFVKEIEKITWHHEYPVGSGSVYAQWCVMSLPGKFGVKVLLDGQGADEYLCGYDELKYYAIWNLFHQGYFSDFLRERKLFKENYGRHGRLGVAYLVDPLLKLFGVRRPVYKDGFTIKEQLKTYTTTRLGELLRYADRNSMAYSIEVRLPFLSHKLVEFVFSIPDNLIYREGKTKFILRESMKAELPEKIYNRTDKIGFAPPQKDWVESEVFMSKYSEGLKVLSDAGLQPGADKFKNLATATFIKVFKS